MPHDPAQKVPMHLRYIRLEAIRQAFADRFSRWRFMLPDLPAPCGDLDDFNDEVSICGWDILYVFDFIFFTAQKLIFILYIQFVRMKLFPIFVRLHSTKSCPGAGRLAGIIQVHYSA